MTPASRSKLVEAFDPVAGVWQSSTAIAQLTAGRQSPAAATGLDGRIYVVGGKAGDVAGVTTSLAQAFTPPSMLTAAGTSTSMPDLPCHFILGFATFASLIPDRVGTCLDYEGHNPTNGDALQHTTGGLLVWRRADNWTAFTDGYHTWINGPNGLQERLNAQRFSWEANPGNLPVI